MDSFLDGRLIIETGDLTRETVDAVVNAANSSLMGGGGVDGAIHRAGGPAILRECREIRSSRYPDGLPTGEAVVTTGGELPARFVIHTVGPVWSGGRARERELLASSYRNSLQAAAGLTLETVAFPAISTGVYGFPKEPAADIAFRTVADFLSHSKLPRQVRFVFFSEADRAIFLKAIRPITSGKE